MSSFNSKYCRHADSFKIIKCQNVSTSKYLVEYSCELLCDDL